MFVNIEMIFLIKFSVYNKNENIFINKIYWQLLIILYTTI